MRAQKCPETYAEKLLNRKPEYQEGDECSISKPAAKNRYLGLPDSEKMDKIIEETCLNALNALDKAKLILMEDSATLVPTEAGK